MKTKSLMQCKCKISGWLVCNFSFLLRLQVCDWPLGHPGLDVGDGPHPVDQVLDLGEVGEGALIRKAGAEVERHNISPGKSITSKVLASTTRQPLLKVCQTVGNCFCSVLLHHSLVLGEECLASGLKQIVERIHNLIGLGTLKTVATGKANLSGDKPTQLRFERLLLVCTFRNKCGVRVA